MNEKSPTRESVCTNGPRASRLPVWLRRTRKLITGLLALGMLLQILVVFTPLGDRLQRWLDVTQDPSEADVIVCLGGQEQRILWAAELYHRQFAPIVIVTNKPGAAEMMRHRLIQSGVRPEDARVDNRSRRTADHPAGIAALEGIDPKTQRFLIVTNAEHSRRAAACFRKAGYSHFTVYSGEPIRVRDKSKRSWRDRVMVLPYLAYEYAGLLQYWWRGYI